VSDATPTAEGSEAAKKITKEEAEAAEAKFLKEQAKEKSEGQEWNYDYDDYDYDDSEHDYSHEDDWMGAGEDNDQGGPENR
jgi:hypothetical protein